MHEELPRLVQMAIACANGAVEEGPEVEMELADILKSFSERAIARVGNKKLSQRNSRN